MARHMSPTQELRRLRLKAGLVIGDALGAMGWEIRRLARNPDFSLLGLRSLDIRTIIDVGANTGQFAKSYLEFFPRARMFSFEPLDSPFRELSSWAKSEPRVLAFQLAIGDVEGNMQMIEHTDHTVSSSFLPATKTSLDIWPAEARDRRCDVRVMTLDGALAGHTLQDKILVKLDTQGYEDRVIRGASETLRRATAAIVEVIVNPLYEGQAEFKDIVSGLEVAGLKFAGVLNQMLAKNGRVLFLDALFLRRQVS